MPNPAFSTLKIERSVIHQIVCILKEKSIGGLKITYGHYPPCIRKAISGTFLFRSTFVNFLAIEKCAYNNLFVCNARRNWRLTELRTQALTQLSSTINQYCTNIQFRNSQFQLCWIRLNLNQLDIYCLLNSMYHSYNKCLTALLKYIFVNN